MHVVYPLVLELDICQYVSWGWRRWLIEMAVLMSLDAATYRKQL